MANLCPGERVEFMCALSTFGENQWQIPSLGIQQTIYRVQNISVPPFRFIAWSGMMMSSSAIVTATEDLNGTLVLCWDDYYTENVNITMNIIGKHSEIIVKCTVLCFCVYMHAII